jgi:hypothetical protein
MNFKILTLWHVEIIILCTHVHIFIKNTISFTTCCLQLKVSFEIFLQHDKLKNTIFLLMLQHFKSMYLNVSMQMNPFHMSYGLWIVVYYIDFETKTW